MRIVVSYALAILTTLSAVHPAALPGQAPQDTVAADSLQETPLYRLDEIRVTVTRSRDYIQRLPYAISVVPGSQIQGAEATISLDEALDGIPGVFVNNRHNFALGNRISIRGFGARSQFGVRGIRILQDGIPLTLPDGQAQLNNVDLGAAGRIEVIRGPASSLYGNASGGVISIETERPPPVPFRPEIRLLGGSFGDDRYYQKYDVKAAGRSGDFGYVAHLSHFQTDGFRLHSAAENTLVNTRLRYALDERSDLTAVVNYVNSPVAQNPSALPRELLEQNRDTVRGIVLSQNLGESSKQGQAGLTYRRVLGSEHEISVMGYGLLRELDNPIPFTRIQLDRLAGGGRVEYRLTPLRAALNVLTVGIDLDHQSDDRLELSHPEPDEVQLDQDERVTSVGLFAHAGVELTPALEVTAGARYDRVRFEADDNLVEPPGEPDDSGSRTLDQLSPMLGLRYTHAPWLNIYGNVGRAFQTPTTTELTDPRRGGFSPSLDPERVTNFEIGLKGSAGGRLSYNLALYQAKIDDQLIASRPPEIDRDVFTNAGESTHRGVELGATALLVRGLTLTTAYTLSDFEFDEFRVVSGDEVSDFGGNEVPGIPPHRLHAELRYRHPVGLSGTAELDLVDGFFADNSNQVETDAYEVVNLRFAYTLRVRDLALEPFLGINNLFDTEYVSSVVVNDARGNFFEPAPGRNLYLGLRTALR